MFEMCGEQAWTADASVVLFYTAVIERPMRKYPTPRLYRFMMTDLGNMSQSFYLLTTWLNLNAFFVGALREQVIEEELRIDWTREIVLGASGLGLATPEGLARERAERAFEPTLHVEQRFEQAG
jgi:SagB-type dehydrogenase family enzyme